MKWYSWVLAFVLVPASLWLCWQVIGHSTSNQAYKNDYAELNHVKYGLLNVDEWKHQITGIFSKEIDELNLSKATERQLRKHLEPLLGAMLDQAVRQIRVGNSGTLGGWFRQTFINLFINWDDVKKGIPEYANAIIREIKKTKTQKEVKTYLRQQLKHYSEQIQEPLNLEPLDHILSRLGIRDVVGARLQVNRAIAENQKLILRESALLILGAVLVFSIAGVKRRPLTPAWFAALVYTLVLLLVVGVTTPTIDLEARISELSFMLLGHPIRFENQVMYFQSKSLLDVFRILIQHRDLDMKLVGVLLITFSIIFPALKLISSCLFYFNYRGARGNAMVRFFVLRSGKWSMADVMVVAIFMAYIGFNGMIVGLFGQMREAGGPDLRMITTNGTALQPGYFVFLAYTLLALFFAGFLNRKPIRTATDAGANVEESADDF